MKFCKRGPKKVDQQKLLASELKKVEENQKAKKQRVNQIINYMRDRIYQDQLKPYFKGGAYNHINFCRKFFKEDRRMTIHLLGLDDKKK